MTLKARVIPCLDVKDGRVVKGVNFEGVRDAGDPVECAMRYEAEGADEIAVLDISASDRGHATALETVRRIAESLLNDTFDPLQGVDALFTTLSFSSGRPWRERVVAAWALGATMALMLVVHAGRRDVADARVAAAPEVRR